MAIKIITVLGARPQFIKAAVVSRALQQSGHITELILHTGQHYDPNMSDIFFTEMQLPRPAWNLKIKESLHGVMTAKMLVGIEAILLQEKPAAVLVYGDTNSTMAAALAASKLHIPVVHVEAGLRSFNMRMPEEINRIITDKLSTLLFCPTQTAVDNLNAENYPPAAHHIYLTGDVMYDAALFYFKQSTPRIIDRLQLHNKPFILASLHRAENTDDPEKLKSIITALNDLCTGIKVVVPLHPRTAKLVEQYGIQPRFTVMDPVGYFDMLQLLYHCALVITDSGGLQKEAYFFKKYSVIMREQTEWKELTDNGFAVIAGSNGQAIATHARHFLNTAFTGEIALYGEGNAGNKIVHMLEKHFCQPCAS